MNVTRGAWTAQRAAGSGNRQRAVWCAVAFLCLSAPILAVGGRWQLAAMNLALTALLFWAQRSNAPIASLVSGFAPILIATAVAYGEVPALVGALGSSYRDGLIQGWEQTVFGTQPSRTFAGAVPVLGLSELLHGGYMAFYLATFLPPLALFARDEREGFAETVLTMTVTWTVCCAFFAFFPVQGPRYLWSTPAGLPDGPLRRLSMAILAAGSARGAAFPSLHMAASVSQSIMAWRWQPRWVAWFVTVVTVLVGFGAVYAGYHYALDMVAGAAVGALVGTVVRGNAVSRPNAVEP